jgi:hypothetical protein
MRLTDGDETRHVGTTLRRAQDVASLCPTGDFDIKLLHVARSPLVEETLGCLAS